MARSDPRPHLWKVQGEIPHKQHIAWHRARSQAHYRGEPWDLTFEQFQQVWQGYWELRGRGAEDYVMSREDPEGAWDITNVQCIKRIDYLRRQGEYKRRT